MARIATFAVALALLAPVPAARADEAEDRAVEKRRTRIPLDGGLVAEVDDFAGRHEGLRIVEVEFPSERAALAFTPPAWFGADVSDAPWASNSWLSVHELPPDLR